MGEDRLGLMKEIVREAKAVGLSPRDRRELVIEKVASADLSQEQAGVKNTAINKYWETKNLDSPLPVLIVVGHHKQPGQGELFTLLRDKYPQRNPEEINASITNWLAAPDDKKPHKVGSPDDPAYPLYRSIYAARQVNESYTKAMAGKIADGESAKLAQIIAKKSRMFADTNRQQRFNQPRGVGKDEEFIQTKEYPTSGRSAWYFVLEKLAKNRPFLQVAIHGMDDRKTVEGQTGYDFVIGSSNQANGETGQLADPKVLEWFARGLAEKLGGENLAVAIDSYRKTVETFQAGPDGQVSQANTAKLGEGLSGVGLGLDWFRTGQILTVENSGKTFNLPGFGNSFNTIQLEISRRVRKDEKLRNKAAQAIRELCLEFAEKFKA